VPPNPEALLLEKTRRPAPTTKHTHACPRASRYSSCPRLSRPLELARAAGRRRRSARRTDASVGGRGAGGFEPAPSRPAHAPAERASRPVRTLAERLHVLLIAATLTTLRFLSRAGGRRAGASEKKGGGRAPRRNAGAARKDEQLGLAPSPLPPALPPRALFAFVLHASVRARPRCRTAPSLRSAVRPRPRSPAAGVGANPRPQHGGRPRKPGNGGQEGDPPSPPEGVVVSESLIRVL
jgi:hypothetical protein